MRQNLFGDIALATGAIFMSVGMASSAAAAPDPGKKACVKEARVLCPSEMKSMSRKKVEACMIENIKKTTPVCHAAMLKIKAERETKAKGGA